jgi:hypothetical protein
LIEWEPDQVIFCSLPLEGRLITPRPESLSLV